MKRTLFLTLALASCFSAARAATYSDLSKDIIDSTNNVYYSQDGYFAVNSATNSTSVDVVLDYDALKKLGTGSAEPILVWDSDGVNYGVCVKDGYLYGYWDNKEYDGTAKSLADLESYVSEGKVTLRITNGQNSDSTHGKGVTISAVKTTPGVDGAEPVATVTPLANYSSLCSSKISAHTGYYVNTSVISSVTLNTASAAFDMSKMTPYASLRTDGTSVGRLMFVGDSITHGYDNRGYRWHLFKTLADNGIENEIVGPRDGHRAYDSQTFDYGSNVYGGDTFANVHLAESSGRTHNIVDGSQYAYINGKAWETGVKYSGHSSYRTGLLYDCNTYVCLMGTNDLLSDNGKADTIAPPSDYCDDMAKMLGGTVSYDAASEKWTWQKDASNLGTMGTIASDLMNSDSDVYYVLSIPSWTEKNSTHGNDDTARAAVAQYNGMLQEWVNHWNTDNSASTQGTMKYVNVNRGLVDVTAGKLISPNNFFSATDGLHPTDQGALIIAGNLAKEMGIGGRTAGLARAAMGTQGTEWTALSVGSDGVVAAGQNLTLAEDIFFTINDGYTVDFGALFGDGEENGWLGKDDASMSITVADGVHSGTLKLSEGYIMWGDTVLFCQDNSKLTDEGNLRIAWHNGNAVDNVLSGYYVWLGDMLIGQACESTATLNGFNGITLSTQGAEALALISNLTYANTAYAPTLSSTQMSSAQYGYLAEQVTIRNATSITSGVDYRNAKSNSYSNNGIVSMNFTGDVTYSHTNTTKQWVGLTRAAADDNGTKRSFNYEEKGTLGAIFGTMDFSGTGDAGKLVVDVRSDAEIKGFKSTYTGVSGDAQVGIAGAYGAASADEFNLYIHGGKIGTNTSSKAHIVGGAILGAGSIGKVNIVVNDGYIRDNIYGGSYGAGASGATVGSATITINGGRIDGDIVAGGTHGKIGNTDIVINGGYIGGSITMGAAQRQQDATTSVTVVGNKADIRGNIEADKVTLKDVSKLANYSNGFDNYSGTIKTPELVLDNVQTEMSASYDGLQKLSALNGTNTSLIGGDALSLEELSLGAGTTVGLFKGADRTVSTATETMLTVTGSLTIAGEGATLNANLVLTADSTLNLGANSLELGSSLTLGGGALDDATLAAVLGLESGCSLELFTGVDELIVGNGSYTGATELAASVAFNNAELASPDFRLVYTGATAGGIVSIMSIPEPTTATLSLLALAGLAARRRRK